MRVPQLGQRDLQNKLEDAFESYQAVSFACVLGLAGMGIGLKLVDKSRKLDAFLEKVVENKKQHRLRDSRPRSWRRPHFWDSFSLVCWGATSTIRRRAKRSKTWQWSKPITRWRSQTGDAFEAVKEIEIYDNLTRKLQVGHFLRNWELDEFQQTKAKVLRGRLEQLKDLVEAGSFEDAKAMSFRVSNAHRRCREAFKANS